MPGHIRRKRWPQAITLFLALLMFMGGWWLEERYLKPSGWQRPLGQLASGEYDVQRVIDGDTIVLKQSNLRVRLQGIDTPETVKKNLPVELWGPEASDYTRQFLEASRWRVRLEIDGEPVDRYGRHLAFLWYDGRLLNEELVQQGFAHAKTDFDFSQSMKKRLREAQYRAKAAHRGIWSE